MAQKAVHALQEQQRHQNLSQEQLTKRQQQRASAAQKAVHALQEQHRHQKLSQEKLTKRTAQKNLQRAQKETTNAGTKWKAPRTVAEMMKAFWAQGDTYSAG